MDLSIHSMLWEFASAAVSRISCGVVIMWHSILLLGVALCTSQQLRPGRQMVCMAGAYCVTVFCRELMPGRVLMTLHGLCLLTVAVAELVAY
jgi:hypothetical protein